jgi:hypothetical protein
MKGTVSAGNYINFLKRRKFLHLMRISLPGLFEAKIL